MNLIIDQGNTLIKCAVFLENKLMFLHRLHPSELETELRLLSKEYPNIKRCIFSSVGKVDNDIIQQLESKYDFIHLDHSTPVPFKNSYATPTSLGVDRIALVSAAATRFPISNVLIIDAGSCITYDFLDASNRYLGGSISPGIRMRYKAMHTFTANLPLLTPNLSTTVIGNSTVSSMHSGVIQALVFEVDGFIEWYRKKYDDLTVILTGGDAHFLRDSIKSDIFANSNFLLEGLNYILEHNKD